jgi:hypothetical protein
MVSRAVFAAVLFVLAQTDASCSTTGGGAGGGGGTATTDCPIPAPYKVDVSAAADISSVTVQAGDAAMDERASNAPWCDTTEVLLTKLDVATAVSNNGCPGNNAITSLPCSPDGMLAALEVKPTPISFPAGSRPELVYDLDANPPQEGCELCTLAVYQRRQPPVAGQNNWRWVANAARATLGSTDIARAFITHFSVFALVELPAPEAIQPGAADGVFIVESDFISEQEGPITVQLTFQDGRIDTARELDRGVSRLFRFDLVEPVAGLDDPGCPGTPAESMTCLFPIGTEVNVLVSKDGLVSIGRVSDAYRVDFTATVEIL